MNKVVKMLSNQQQSTETIPITVEDLSIKSSRALELDAIAIDVVPATINYFKNLLCNAENYF